MIYSHLQLVEKDEDPGLSSSYVFFTHSTRQAKDINVSRNGIK